MSRGSEFAGSDRGPEEAGSDGKKTVAQISGSSA